MNQSAKIAAFRALHQGPHAFVMPNPWDLGSLRILEALGFEAFGTTSAGLAFTLGLTDGTGALSRDQVLAHCQTLVEATDRPVSADLENGYGDAPEAVAETIRLAVAVGLAGASIEDATGRHGAPVYDFSLAVERIQAAVETIRALDVPG